MMTDNVHGILLQHPVPHQIDERLCFDAIDIKKMLMVLPVLVLEICLWVCLLMAHARQLEL